MVAVLAGNPFADLSFAHSTLLGGGVALRPGMGACMADRPTRPCLRRVGDLRSGCSFVCRLSRVMGRVLGRSMDSKTGVEVELLRVGRRTVKRLDPRVLVEVIG